MDVLHLTNIVIIILAYLLGSIPSGVWIGKIFYKKDIRDFGSGGSGTTNAFRVLGPPAGIAVFAIDALKGTLACYLPELLGSDMHPLIPGVLAILGHTYPIFAGFKGGKAVATSAGIGLFVSPGWLLSMLAVFFLVLYLSSMVSMASIVAIFVAAITAFFLFDWWFALVILVVWIFVVYRHRTNVQRIMNGTENLVPFGLNYRRKKGKYKD